MAEGSRPSATQTGAVRPTSSGEQGGRAQSAQRGERRTSPPRGARRVEGRTRPRPEASATQGTTPLRGEAARVAARAARVQPGAEAQAQTVARPEAGEATQAQAETAAVGGEVAGPAEATTAQEGINAAETQQGDVSVREVLKKLAGAVKEGKGKREEIEKKLNALDKQMLSDAKDTRLPVERRSFSYDFSIARLQMQLAPTRDEISKIRGALTADDRAAADQKMSSEDRRAQQARLDSLTVQITGTAAEPGPLIQLQQLQQERNGLEGGAAIPNQFQSLAERLCVPLGISMDRVQNNPLGSVMDSIMKLRNIPPEQLKERTKFLDGIKGNFADKKEYEDVRRLCGERIGKDKMIDLLNFGGVWTSILIIALILQSRRAGGGGGGGMGH